MQHYIIFYQYLSIKKTPKFQYWITGSKKIIIDHSLSKDIGVPEHEYTKTLITAKTLIKTDDIDKTIKNMSKYFNDFTAYYNESIIITDLDNFNHLLFPNFTNNTTV